MKSSTRSRGKRDTKPRDLFSIFNNQSDDNSSSVNKKSLLESLNAFSDDTSETPLTIDGPLKMNKSSIETDEINDAFLQLKELPKKTPVVRDYGVAADKNESGLKRAKKEPMMKGNKKVYQMEVILIFFSLFSQPFFFNFSHYFLNFFLNVFSKYISFP